MPSKAELALIISLKDEVEAAARAIKGDLREVGETARSVRDDVGGLGGMIGSVLAGAGKLAAAGLGLGIGAAGALAGAAMAAGGTVDEAFDTIQISTGATGKELEELQRDFGAVFSSIPTQAGPAAEAISVFNQRLDMTGPPLQNLSKQILEMSRILEGDAKTSAELYTRVMGDWGVSTEDASRILDEFFAASQITGAGVDDLMSKVVQFGAPLRLMGFTLDDAIAMFGKWEKEGVNAELVMGSLRIAAGHFAKEQEKAATTTIGGVKSMAEAEEQLADLKRELELATLRQSEFTEKTKESTKAATQARIDDLRKQITKLEAAMAKGEIRTVKATKAQKPLRESLLETFDAIKNNEDATAALALGMEVFGARAGPDMVAAIREGRFEFDELVAALGDSEGAILEAGAATADWQEKLTVLKNKATMALSPLGLELMDVAGIVLDELGPAIERVGPLMEGLGEKFKGGVAAFKEGGLRGLADYIGVPPEVVGLIERVAGGIAGILEGLPKLRDFDLSDLKVPDIGRPEEWVAKGTELAEKLLEGLGGLLMTGGEKLVDLTASLKEWASNPDVLGSIREATARLTGFLLGQIKDTFSDDESGRSLLMELAGSLGRAIGNLAEIWAMLGGAIAAGIFDGLVGGLLDIFGGKGTGQKWKQMLADWQAEQEQLKAAGAKPAFTYQGMTFYGQQPATAPALGGGAGGPPAGVPQLDALVGRSDRQLGRLDEIVENTRRPYNVTVNVSVQGTGAGAVDDGLQRGLRAAGVIP